MNKAELNAALAKKAGFTKKDTETLTGAFIETITEALQRGEKVQLVGFGTYVVKECAPRIARNPRTGEEINVAASKVPVFKAGKTLKNVIQ